ncbi:Glu-tRNA(Gln) amidotransferase subunit GatD [Candidatus Bathyarchaeota archaeon]|nr:Glu-tRNA(Gln) amidotransferase subunit GatD [Candidatus Bathyarchaeota archaeon]
MESDNDELEGYKGSTKKILEDKGVKTWDVVSVEASKKKFEGILLPRNKFDKEGYIDLKLKNGYNVGVRISSQSKFKVLGHEKGEYKLPEKKVKVDRNKPSITLLGTGGTVASRLDYVTGGVIPAFTPAELFSAVPELEEIANIETIVKYEIFSEDVKPKHWKELATAVENAARRGKDGVVIGHGTDTMSYSAAMLSFMLPKLSIPVVFVGSQRSSDRPSSDAALNLIHAMQVAAHGDFAESVICMMGSINHSHAYLHKGTVVRKMHSSTRHTFRTIGTRPFGKVKDNHLEIFWDNYRHRGECEKTVADTKIEEKVALLYTYPAIDPSMISFLADQGYKGLVLAGTGLGHTPHDLFPTLKGAIDGGMSVVMTVQTLWGYTGMNVYETGREELAMGIIDGKNMLPEVAYAKLMWVLGHETDQARIHTQMETNLQGEILSGEPPSGYQVFQGE